MGTNYTGEGSNSGIIPKVMENIFQRVETMRDSTEFLIRVSFIEVKKNEDFFFVVVVCSRFGWFMS